MGNGGGQTLAAMAPLQWRSQDFKVGYSHFHVDKKSIYRFKI
jgi:hypothetical protein